MIHRNRTYQVAEDVTSVSDLAERLTQHTWCLCTAFKLVVGGGVPELLFLNDSFSEDGAQEYAVVCNGRQVESITFSWCSQAEAHNHIQVLVTGTHEDYKSL